VFLQGPNKLLGQYRGPVLAAFAGADSDGAKPEIHVLYPQPDALEDTQSGPIENLGHEFGGAPHAVEDRLYFLWCEHDRYPPFATYPDKSVQPTGFLVQDITIQENQRVQRLGLSAGRDAPLDRQIVQKCLDLFLPKIIRMAFVMEKYVLAGPVNIACRRAWAVVPALAGNSNPIKETRRFGRREWFLTP
jgi:hypothetical protein